MDEEEAAGCVGNLFKAIITIIVVGAIIHGVKWIIDKTYGEDFGADVQSTLHEISAQVAEMTSSASPSDTTITTAIENAPVAVNETLTRQLAEVKKVAASEGIPINTHLELVPADNVQLAMLVGRLQQQVDDMKKAKEIEGSGVSFGSIVISIVVAVLTGLATDWGRKLFGPGS